MEQDLQVKGIELSQIEIDLNNLLEYRDQAERIQNELRQAADRSREQSSQLQRELEGKVIQLDKAEAIIRKVSQRGEEVERQLKQSQLKLRQIEHTKLRDLKKNIQSKDEIIQELTVKLRQMDESFSPKKKGMVRNSTKQQISSEQEIKEVEEKFEST